MLARLGVVFWEASVDVGPTMRDRSANAEFSALFFRAGDFVVLRYGRVLAYLLFLNCWKCLAANLLVFSSEI